MGCSAVTVGGHGKVARRSLFGRGLDVGSRGLRQLWMLGQIIISSGEK